ncbi:S41 family peptidase [Fodinicurvata fenggangensis]|uniref:S41 family peptidase n=1 Tax=Fodinicurvata fenggangensis TaxID=1121830 RepID=UPI0009DCEC87|nr:S41 family peptidase [Fodinicurvata fenggangensis]
MDMTTMRFGSTGYARLAFLAVLMALVLASCASGPVTQGQEGYDQTAARYMFATGYQDINAVYIQDIPIETLAFSGLQKLQDMDGEISVVREADKFLLKQRSETVQSYGLPQDNRVDLWGKLTATIIEDTREISPKIAEAKSEALYETVFEGMIEPLDGYSRYATPEEARENRANRDGFGGIGVRIQLIDKGVEVVNVMDGSPAERAGMDDWDVIVTIDGIPAPKLSQEEVVKRLRGPLGSRVTLGIHRPGDVEDTWRELELVVERAHIVPQTVEYEPLDDVAYFRISGFNHDTTETLRTKLKQAEREMGSRLRGFILDLRSNPGGLLDQAVFVSDLFVGEGRIVSTHGRHPDSHQYFEAKRDAQIPEVPVLVLINGNSASAAEIVAAALQDTERGIVVGSNSYGKGTVQTVLRLPNEGELTLTWATFHAPAGYSLDRRGVLPNVCTSTDSSDGEQAVSELPLEGLISNPHQRKRDIDRENDLALAEFRSICPTSDSLDETDIEIALKLLEDPGILSHARRGAPNTAQRIVDESRGNPGGQP